MNILLVDDDRTVRLIMQKTLECLSFEVVSAANVSEAVEHIASQSFDVLITDLHMPSRAEGVAVVDNMRRVQPQAVTIVLSGYLEMEGAAHELQADEVLEKPLSPVKLSEIIHRRVRERRATQLGAGERIATILEREVPSTIQSWLVRVKTVQELNNNSLSDDERSYYLPDVIRGIATRLRKHHDVRAAFVSTHTAVLHGQLRHRQGYTAPMLVLESTILHQCLFEAIQRNIDEVDSSLVLPNIMLIADEVNSHLTQSIDSLLRHSYVAA